MENKETFCSYLTDLLTRRGMVTTASKADLMGWTLPMQSYFESGKKMPTLARLLYVSEKLDLVKEQKDRLFDLYQTARRERSSQLNKKAFNTMPAIGSAKITPATATFFRETNSKDPSIQQQNKKIGVYLAGAVPRGIHENYRSCLVVLNDHEEYEHTDFENAELNPPFDSLFRVTGPSHDYQHGSLCNRPTIGDGNKSWVKAIQDSDVVFAWIDDELSHGTVWELGYAYALGKYCFVAFSKKNSVFELQKQLQVFENTVRLYPDEQFASEKAEMLKKHIPLKDSMWFLAEHATLYGDFDDPGTAFGAMHQNYLRRNYRDYLNSSHWKETAKEARARAGNRCQVCNSNSERLNVHHRTYERKGFEKPEDLICLCESCHGLFHKNAKLQDAA
jgi:hypothetical protein